eukprot:s4112_g3.t1
MIVARTPENSTVYSHRRGGRATGSDRGTLDVHSVCAKASRHRPLMSSSACVSTSAKEKSPTMKLSRIFRVSSEGFPGRLTVGSRSGLHLFFTVWFLHEHRGPRGRLQIQEFLALHLFISKCPDEFRSKVIGSKVSTKPSHDLFQLADQGVVVLLLSFQKEEHVVAAVGGEALSRNRGSVEVGEVGNEDVGESKNPGPDFSPDVRVGFSRSTMCLTVFIGSAELGLEAGGSATTMPRSCCQKYVLIEDGIMLDTGQHSQSLFSKSWATPENSGLICSLSHAPGCSRGSNVLDVVDGGVGEWVAGVVVVGGGIAVAGSSSDSCQGSCDLAGRSGAGIFGGTVLVASVDSSSPLVSVITGVPASQRWAGDGPRATATGGSAGGKVDDEARSVPSPGRKACRALAPKLGAETSDSVSLWT